MLLIMTVILIPLLSYILSNPVFAQERTKVVWVLAVSMFLMSWGCGEDEPQVVEISPVDGETLNYLSPVTVEFNKPMDLNTVQITVGGVAGDITFGESTTEFVWTPDKWALLLPEGPKRVEIVGADADGAPLMDYQPITVNLSTADLLPRVVGISPRDGGNLYRSSWLTVFFNKPMDPDTVQITVEDVQGDITFDKSATKFVWRLQKCADLSPSGPRRVEIVGADVDGNSLIDFQPITVNAVEAIIEPPLIVGREPNFGQPIDVDISKIVIIFSAPIDSSKTTVLVSTQEGGMIRSEVRWNNNRVEIYFRDPLIPETTYAISLDNLIDLCGFAGWDTGIFFITQAR